MSIHFLGSDSMFEPISNIGMYSDGTPMVKSQGYARICREATTMVVRPHSLQEFVTAMFLYDAFVDGYCQTMKLVLPYLPGARQDRVNPTGDILFTAKSVARMINERPFSKVISLDPHSQAMPNRIDNFVEYPLANVAKQIDTAYYGVIAADKGGRDRAWEFYCELPQQPRDFVTAEKTRDVSNGRLTGFSVDVKPGLHYLVADDICDGGGTFIGLGEKIREQGATADLYVSHGIFSKGTTELKKIYNNIYTTDSREIHERNDVTVIPVVKEMENYNA